MHNCPLPVRSERQTPSIIMILNWYNLWEQVLCIYNVSEKNNADSNKLITSIFVQLKVFLAKIFYRGSHICPNDLKFIWISEISISNSLYIFIFSNVWSVYSDTCRAQFRAKEDNCSTHINPGLPSLDYSIDTEYMGIKTTTTKKLLLTHTYWLVLSF